MRRARKRPNEPPSTDVTHQIIDASIEGFRVYILIFASLSLSIFICTLNVCTSRCCSTNTQIRKQWRILIPVEVAQVCYLSFGYTLCLLHVYS
ncbi:hypothetical protein HDV57DRAFT_358526 [Trichoderma longibrachiatum]